MKSKILGAILVATFAFVGHVHAENDSIKTQYFNYEYDFDWLQNPPEDAEEVPMWISYLCYDQKINLKRISVNDTIKVKGNSIYLPIVKLWVPTYSEKYVLPCNYISCNGWLKGTARSGDIIFNRENGVVGITEYKIEKELTERYVDGVFSKDVVSLDTIVSRDEVKLWSVTEFSGVSGSGDNMYSWDWNRYVEFTPQNKDVTGDYDRRTHTICNLSSGLMLSPTEDSSIRAGASEMGGTYEPTLTQVIHTLIAGQISDTEPVSLPKPEIATKNSIHDYNAPGGIYGITSRCDLDVRLNLVNSDGKLLDPERVYIRVWLDGEQQEDRQFSRYGNPFSGIELYNITIIMREEDYSTTHEEMLPDDYNPSLKVMCYYLNEDGTTVDGPCAYNNCPEGIDETEENIKTAPQTADNRVYDLAGREVNPDRLSPGIYIRNGRKFAVTSRQ